MKNWMIVVLFSVFSVSAQAATCIAEGTNGVVGEASAVFQARAAFEAIRQCQIKGGEDCVLISCQS